MDTLQELSSLSNTVRMGATILHTGGDLLDDLANAIDGRSTSGFGGFGSFGGFDSEDEF